MFQTHLWQTASCPSKAVVRLKKGWSTEFFCSSINTVHENESDSHSVMSDSLGPVACQAPLSVEFSRQGYWSGLAFLSTRDLPFLGIKPGSPALQADYSPSEPPGKPNTVRMMLLFTSPYFFY